MGIGVMARVEETWYKIVHTG